MVSLFTSQETLRKPKPNRPHLPDFTDSDRPCGQDFTSVRDPGRSYELNELWTTMWSLEYLF